MSSVFMKDMQRNMDEDAELTVQHPRQSLEEDRTPDDDFMMDINSETDSETDFQEPESDMDFFFDGMLEALKRSRERNV